MATDDIERLRYYQKQYLGALDFEDQQTYHRDMRRRLNLAHHTWGIVTGLELKDTNTQAGQPTDIYITPGMAIDGYGREIVMFTPTQLDVSLFQHYSTFTHTWTICLKYYENLSQPPQSGYEQCDVLNQYGRVQESFRIVLAIPYTYRDDLSVAGNTVQAPPLDPKVSKPPFPEDQPIRPLSPPTSNLIIPYDESLPYQEFPADDPTTSQFAWLIPLGDVKWDGSLQSLISDDPASPIHTNGRHYVGTVSSRLLAPARTLIVRDRSTTTTLPFKASAQPKNQPSVPSTPSSPPTDGVEMFVEGTLQVDRLLTAKDDIQIHGGALDFRDASGSSDGKGSTDPLFTITRRGNDTTTGIDLRIQIGNDSNGNDHFVVGSGSNDLLKIADNGNATINGDVAISGVLDFGSKTRQMINLWSTNDGKKQYGIGVQMNTAYFRSHSDFCWFQDGEHSDKQGDPGGGQLQLKLDLNGDLYFGNRTRQMLNLWNANYGIGVQASTLYFRSYSDFCWFRGGSHNDAQDNPGGGRLQMKLDTDGGLDVYGPRIAFHSSTNDNFSVTLGQQTGVHGSDSIYGSPNLWLDSDGAVIATQSFRMSRLNGAAFFNIGSPAPGPGDVVVLDDQGNAVQSSNENSTKVIGVAMDWNSSDPPGFILDNEPNPQKKNTSIVVALMGIVHCYVDATTTNGNGEIAIGDLLTTSDTHGYAQKAEDPTTAPRGTVFAKALDHMDLGKTGTIRVLMMLS